MRMLAVIPILASVFLQQAAALGGSVSVAIPGFLPQEYVKARKPEGDGGPNDVYQHLPVRRPTLTSEEIVIYPHHIGFEYGQDPENSIYEVHNARELVAAHNKKHSKMHDKHDKHGKEASHHHHQDRKLERQNHIEDPLTSSYQSPESQQPSQQQHFRPRPSLPSHPHFG